MLPDIPANELADELDRACAKILRRCGVRTPPVDALRMAAALKIETAIDHGQSARARYVELRAARGGPPRPAIILRPEPRAERRQWAVAHEIGEQQAVTLFERLSIDPRAAPALAREWVANQLANRLLLPTRWFARAAAECDWHLPTLKDRFATASHELILRRMLDFDRPVVVTIFDQGTQVFRRGNAAGQFPLTALERNCWQAVHATGGEQVQSDRALAVRGWAVHEENWRRELLRMELPEGEVDWPVAGEEEDAECRMMSDE